MPSFEGRVETLWANPRHICLSAPFVYYICVTDANGRQYRYAGRARNKSRLDEYKKNMLKIRDRRPRGKKQKYRAVHFALFEALENGWKIEFSPVEPCVAEELNSVEKKVMAKFRCNLNGAKTWAIE